MPDEYFQVDLVPGSAPVDPVKSIWFVWEQSRCDDSIEIMEKRYEYLQRGGCKGYYEDHHGKELAEEQVRSKAPEGMVFPVDLMLPRERFRLLMEMEIPIVEFLQFSFILDNINVSFREHLVRHRIGTRIGPNCFVGEEIAADVGLWSQTSRVRDLQNFKDKGQVYVPDIFADDPEATEIYWDTMSGIQTGYRKLRDKGYLPEVCREVLPSAMLHRIAWRVNLKSLKHIFGHRSCWIAMSGYWQPIIRGVSSELLKLDKVFSSLSDPPCIDKRSSCFKKCVFAHENEQRLSHRDPGVPCSLWMHHEKGGLDNNFNQALPTDNDKKEFDRMLQSYSIFWGRDPFTGSSL